VVHTRAVEPEPGAGAQAILDGQSCSRSQKLLGEELELISVFRFNNPSLWGKRVVQIIQWFSVSSGPNHSGAGSSARQWRSQPKIFWGAKKFVVAKMFDFRRIALFCLGYRLSKNKMTTYAKNLESPWPPGRPWIRLWCWCQKSECLELEPKPDI